VSFWPASPPWRRRRRRCAIEEIVVTARRAAESLSDVPISVTAFTSADIEDAGIQRPEDFINLTPNVVMANTANTGDTLVTIRGITSTRDAESNFALVVDGVLITNPNCVQPRVARRRADRGAQRAAGGAVRAQRIVRRDPDHDERAFRDLRGQVTGGIGNNGSPIVRRATSPGAIADNLYGRLSFSRRETDGHFTQRLHSTTTTSTSSRTTRCVAG
jgi:iron complex outermembrane recepter protein